MNWNDPNAAQEAQNYTNPIPSRLLILQTLAEQGDLTQRQLAEFFGIAHQGEDQDRYEALGNRLRAMIRAGQIRRSGRPSVYQALTQKEVVVGTVSAHAKGFGFVILPDMPDLFLPEAQMRWVFNGDRVQAIGTHTDGRGRTEGRIVALVDRPQTQFVGKLEEDDEGYFVQLASPNNHQPITVTAEDVEANQARLGVAVLVNLIDPPTQHEFATGKIARVLNDDNDREVIIETTLLNHNIPHEFSESALKQANAYQAPDAKDFKDRQDLRDLPLVTIDGEDSRDFDDAVFAEKRRGGGYRVLVAIADVSHYVTPNSPLDHEAYERGTSVYFPHHVVPMLPEVLSNDLCSLNPDVDRLCMVADMKVSRAGKITDYEFYPAVMHSQARLTYNQVNAYFTGDKDTKVPESLTKNKAVKKSIDTLYQLYQVLLQRRAERHAMEFETQETYIKFNEQGGIDAIIPRTRGDAHKLIEECMLLANTCAANFALKHDLPVLYRNHDKPDAEKSRRIHEYAKNFGIAFPQENPTQADYQKIIQATKDRPDAISIHSMLLRSMMQANYAPTNIGHFGLAYDEYSHFTSPIRRYPDLMLHRAIKAKTQGKPQPITDFSLEEAGTQTSETERRAEEASRFVETWLKCHYMKDHLGETYQGVITTVTNFGLFVTLTNLFIEGLIHISQIGDDYYLYDEQTQQLIGQDTKQIYGLGDIIQVKVAKVNMETLQIDFDLIAKIKASAMNQPKKKRRERPKRKKP